MTTDPMIRMVDIGGLTRTELRAALQAHSIALNALAETLFACESFATAPIRHSLTTIEVTVQDLGFPNGATMAELLVQAAARGFAACPIELGPHLRLQYTDQPEGYWDQPVRSHQAPSGSITVISLPLFPDDDTFPKGMYLRRIKGELYLRGYCCGADHRWSATDQLLFRKL